jgi:hypothetical protein
MFKIIVTMLTVTGQPIESFDFNAAPFPNEAACRAFVASNNFQVQLADLQLRLENLVAAGRDAPRGAKLTGNCVPI